MSPLIEYRRIHRDDPLSISYLKYIYAVHYPELFPDPEDREDWGQWIDYLEQDPDNNFFIIAGENMDDPGKVVLHGFTIGYYFRQSQTGLLCYIGVDRNCRSSGVATGLIDHLTTMMTAHAQKHGLALNGFFAEANDPAQITAAEDSLPPATRLKIYHRWNALQVPVRYSVPCIHRPWRKDGYMLLLSLPVNGVYAQPDAAIGMIADYYRSAELTPEKDPDFLRQKQELEDWGGYISLAAYDPVRNDGHSPNRKQGHKQGRKQGRPSGKTLEKPAIIMAPTIKDALGAV